MAASDNEPDPLAEVRAVQDRATAPKSKTTYNNKIFNFLEYLLEKHIDLLAPPFREAVRPSLLEGGDTFSCRSLIARYLDRYARHPEQSPFPLSPEFKVDHLLLYLLYCTKTKGNSASTLNGVCSGIRHLFVRMAASVVD